MDFINLILWAMIILVIFGVASFVLTIIGWLVAMIFVGIAELFKWLFGKGAN